MFVICDLDGTLSDDIWRRATFDPNDPSKYNKISMFDEANEPVCRVIEALARFHTIEIWTARPDWLRASTEEWLDDHLKCNYSKLRMRQESDHRHANEIKEEWLDEVLKQQQPGLEIMVFDDRKTCVEFWRNRGFFCFDVAGNNF